MITCLPLGVTKKTFDFGLLLPNPFTFHKKRPYEHELDDLLKIEFLGLGSKISQNMQNLFLLSSTEEY